MLNWNRTPVHFRFLCLLFQKPMTVRLCGCCEIASSTSAPWGALGWVRIISNLLPPSKKKKTPKIDRLLYCWWPVAPHTPATHIQAIHSTEPTAEHQQLQQNSSLCNIGTLGITNIPYMHRRHTAAVNTTPTPPSPLTAPTSARRIFSLSLYQTAKENGPLHPEKTGRHRHRKTMRSNIFQYYYCRHVLTDIRSTSATATAQQSHEDAPTCSSLTQHILLGGKGWGTLAISYASPCSRLLWPKQDTCPHLAPNVTPLNRHLTAVRIFWHPSWEGGGKTPHANGGHSAAHTEGDKPTHMKRVRSTQGTKALQVSHSPILCFCTPSSWVCGFFCFCFWWVFFPPPTCITLCSSCWTQQQTWHHTTQNPIQMLHRRFP